MQYSGPMAKKALTKMDNGSSPCLPLSFSLNPGRALTPQWKDISPHLGLEGPELKLVHQLLACGTMGDLDYSEHLLPPSQNGGNYNDSSS